MHRDKETLSQDFAPFGNRMAGTYWGRDAASFKTRAALT